MGHEAFISYAREPSRPYAEALHRELGGAAGLAFLDTTDIEAGAPIPPTLVDALLDAKVVVIFAGDAYFQRWFCQWEYRAALAPYLALEPGASEEAKRSALAPVVIALPPQGSPPFQLDRLPPQLRTMNWVRADETERLAEMVRQQVRQSASLLRDRIDATVGFNARTRAFALEEASLPPPMKLAGFTPLYPLQRSPSLGASFVGRADELWRIHFTLAAMRGEAVGATLTGGRARGRRWLREDAARAGVHPPDGASLLPGRHLLGGRRCER